MPAPVAAAAARAAASRAGASRAATAASLVGTRAPRSTKPVASTASTASVPLFPARSSSRRRSGVSSGSSVSVVSGTRFVRVLKAEWLLCVVILGLSPLADPDGEESIGDAIKRVAAATGVFFILGLVAAAGPKPAKAAAGLGGLMTIALLVSSRDVFGAVADRLQTGFRGVAGSDGDAGSALGGAAADAAQGGVDIIRGTPDTGSRPPGLGG